MKNPSDKYLIQEGKHVGFSQVEMSGNMMWDDLDTVACKPLI